MPKKKKTVEQIRQETFRDVKRKLKAYHLCAIPRPTGFGKTCMATDLISTKKYKNILYVYPTEVIRQAVCGRYYDTIELEADTKETVDKMTQIDGVTMWTYCKLARESKNLKALPKCFDLIIFDECHRIGAEKTLPGVKYLIKHNDADVIGMTATPNRGDGFDVIEEVFDGITVFPYTLHDAFKDGIYKVPYYCYVPCAQSIPEILTDIAFMAGEDIEDLKIKQVLKRKVLEICKIEDAPKIIKEACTEIFKKPSYMKFICFYSKHARLDVRSKEIENFFKTAFPKHTIRNLEITSRNPETINNIKKLPEYTRTKNTIDLIHCVDMMNMGIHAEDLTGIVMYRTTNSDIIYPQEYGRVLRSGDPNEHIIFDLVDNLHRNAVFQNPIRKTTGTGTTSGPDIPPDDTPPVIDIDGNGNDTGIDTRTTSGPDIPPDDIPPTTNTGGTSSTDVNGPETSDPDDPEDDTESKVLWYLHMNDMTPEDIKFTHSTATYREQIAKLVAEPIQMRCKEAFEAHFKRWCKMNGVNYPITNRELKTVYNLDKQDFIDYFENLIKTNKLNYPMRDAQKLLDIGRKRKDGLPMDVFAKWKNISIKQILDLLDVA